jgi:hypothetical protein
MSDEPIAGPGTSLFRSMSCGDEGDELAILPIAVFDLVSLLTFSLVQVLFDHLVNSVALHACVLLQGGNELCRIEGFGRRKAISKLKVSIEAEAGLVPALTRLIHPESQVELQDHLTLEDAGMPSEHTLAEGVIRLCAQKLKKVVVADELQIAPGEVTDTKLTVFCDSIRDDPPNILVLCGCHGVTNISCLAQLSTISHLDISSCDLGAEGGFHLAGAIKDMRALTSLDISDNKIPLDLSQQMMQKVGCNKLMPLLVDTTLTELDVSGIGFGSEGAAAVAKYISDNGAISSVNLLKNNIGDAQAEDLVSILKAHPTRQVSLRQQGQRDCTGHERQNAWRRGCHHACPGYHQQQGFDIVGY